MSGQTARSRALARSRRIAESEAASKRHVDFEREHFIYRCWDAEGRLLYIGCTQDLEARMAVHRSSWSNPASAYLNFHMAKYAAEPEAYRGRVAARAAEKEAIKAERPLLNLHHNAGRGLPRVPAAPITEADREALQVALNSIFAGMTL